MSPTRRKASRTLADPNAAAEVDDLWNAVAASGFPVGTMAMWGGAEAPAGWVICDGRSLKRSDHPDLFEAIGYRFANRSGGDTFAVPDMRATVPIGAQIGTAATYPLATKVLTFDVGTPAAPKTIGLNFIIKV